VNGDGFSDVVVGLPYGPGNIDVYFGGDPMDATVDLILFEEPPELYFGCAVATGDVNGDGYCDIVASDYYKNGGRGAAYVFYGGPLLDNVPDITLRGHGYEGFGMTLGSGGDVNSDGYDDIVVGAWDNDDLYGDAGRIYIYYGGNPMDTVYDAAMYGEGPGHLLGWQPVDICRDSFLWSYDFVVAATMFWPDGFPGMCPGKLYILSGGNPMDGIPDLWMHGQRDSSGLGIVSSAGDVDGDGIEDVVGGAIVEVDYMGAVYLWLAGPGMDTLPDAWAKGDSAFLGLGWTVSSAGDVNGDGRDEVAFSNCFYNAAGHPAHTVWVCRYTGTGVNENGAQAWPREVRCSIRCQPNPFRHRALIEVSGARIRGQTEGRVALAIHDTAGRLVKSFGITKEAERFTWDGHDEAGLVLPSGVYFLSVTPEQTARPVKLTLVR
jgi:hypothetical protein